VRGANPVECLSGPVDKSVYGPTPVESYPDYVNLAFDHYEGEEFFLAEPDLTLLADWLRGDVRPGSSALADRLEDGFDKRTPVTLDPGDRQLLLDVLERRLPTTLDDLLGRLRNFKLAEEGAADPQDNLGAESPDERGR
jgi:hypothetical protein